MLENFLSVSSYHSHIAYTLQLKTKIIKQPRKPSSSASTTLPHLFTPNSLPTPTMKMWLTRTPLTYLLNSLTQTQAKASPTPFLHVLLFLLEILWSLLICRLIQLPQWQILGLISSRCKQLMVLQVLSAVLVLQL